MYGWGNNEYGQLGMKTREQQVGVMFNLLVILLQAWCGHRWVSFTNQQLLDCVLGDSFSLKQIPYRQSALTV